MKLLLDTHAFIWWDDRSTRLSARARAACSDPANSLHLSIVSVWELQIKGQLGKFELEIPLRDLLADQQSGGLVIKPMTVEDVLGLADLPMIHRDPFDRLLISQARRGGYHLVSQDAAISRYEVASSGEPAGVRQTP